MRYFLPLLCLLMVACSSSDDAATPTPDAATASFYVVNQGSYYDGIDGSISAVDTETGAVVSDAFMTQNGVSIGGSPQAGCSYDATFYVPAFESNRVWALSAENLQVQQAIVTNVPNAVQATQDYLFVTNNDGYLSVYNRSDLSLVKQLAVGPNPYNMARVGNEIFVSISDGYNYPTYENGYRLARVSVSDLSMGEPLSVGMNPGQLLATAGDELVVVCRGDYGMTPSMVYKVNPATGVSTYICDGSYIALQGETLLVINAVTDWTTYETVNTYEAYNVGTGDLLRTDILEAPLPAMPIAIQCLPNGDILVASQLSLYDYTSPGILYHYDADGNYKTQYAVGVSPCGVLY